MADQAPVQPVAVDERKPSSDIEKKDDVYTSDLKAESLSKGSLTSESDDNPHGLTDKYILRKLDWKLLPPLTLLYLLSFLDRSNGKPRPSSNAIPSSPYLPRTQN